METCSICGKSGELRGALVEGSVVRVCNSCSRYGNVIEVRPQKIERKVVKLKVEEENEMIIPNYFEKIKKARERLNITQEELASMINEKVSVISALETGRLVPTLGLAKKLERVLDIKLIDYYKLDHVSSKIDLKNESLTVADIVKLNKSKDLKE